MLTVVLDTQTILRGASSATFSITAEIYDAWNAGRFTLLRSEPILAEIEDVLVRPEVLRKFRMTPVEAAALIERLRRQGLVVTPAVRIARSRDPDVLSLSEVEGIPIIDADALHFPHGNEKEAVASPRIWSLGTVPPARAPVVTAATKKT